MDTQGSVTYLGNFLSHRTVSSKDDKSHSEDEETKLPEDEWLAKGCVAGESQIGDWR